jgi:primosomal protein N'
VQLLLKGRQRAAVHAAARALARAAQALPATVRVLLDVDPQSML